MRVILLLIMCIVLSCTQQIKKEVKVSTESKVLKGKPKDYDEQVKKDIKERTAFKVNSHHPYR